MDLLPPWRPDETPETPTLKPHQREVALLVGKGLTNDQIAARLGTTPGWVGMQIGRIVQRLGLTCRADIRRLDSRRAFLPPGRLDTGGLTPVDQSGVVTRNCGPVGGPGHGGNLAAAGTTARRAC